MDRRSIITVILLTISFFGINYYFDMKRVDNIKKTQLAEKQELATSPTLSNEDILRRTAPLKTLGLVQLYAGDTEREMIGYGYQQGNSIITLQWSENPPTQLYVGTKTSNAALLISEDSDIGMPILYSSGEEQVLTTLSLPQLGRSDVQVVTMNAQPSVYLGIYEGGSITFPGDMPPENGLVLYSNGGQYYIVGYYDLNKGAYIPLSDVTDFTSKLRYIPIAGANVAKNETFYVLENDYLQLVISSAGASLSEINLPLRGNKHPNSIVRPIQFDKTIDKKYPENALFPEKPYLMADQSGSMLKMDPVKGGYYPLLRRGIYGGGTAQSIDAPVRYNGLNLVSDDPYLSTVRFEVTRFTDSEIVLRGKYKGQTIERRYVLPNDPEKSPYVFDSYISFQGNQAGMWVTTGVPEVELISGSFMPALKYAKMKNTSLTVDQIKQPKPTTTVENTPAEWISNGNGFFGIILDPLTFSPQTIQAGQLPGEADPSRITVIDAKYDLYPAKDYPGYELLMPLGEGGGEAHIRVFAGPFDATVLKKVDAAYTDTTTGIGPEYINTQSFHGWFSFISEPFAKFLLILMNFFHVVTGSWGLSIILLTVALRVMLYPLNNWSIKSMAKVQEVGPKLERIREKYKKDQRRMQAEVMKLYKEEGGNPFSGCLPLLIQMPFLIGMFDLLKSSFELRGASFIPGWIDNLASPDILFSWSYPIPFIGTSFHLLPILLGVVMFFQQRASQKQSKRKHAVMTDQQKQQQQMGKIMTLVFTVLFYKSPSGLNLYWISSMGLSVLQQWFTVKRMGKNKNQ